MAIPWKLYLTCWFLGASVQSATFFSYNAVDYFNYFFPDNYKPEVYVGVTVGVAASVGALLMVTFPPKSSHLTVLLFTLTASVILLVAVVVITPLDTGILSTPARFGLVLAVIFVATVVQNVGGGALYSFAGKHFPKFGVHAAQSGGVFAFAATFIIRCISKGSFQYVEDKDNGFRLSGYLFVALVDLTILVACCLISILRAHVPQSTHAKRFNVTDRESLEDAEDNENQPLLTSDEFGNVSRREIIRNNWAALTAISVALAIACALFPGIASQFHGNYNCTFVTNHLSNSSNIFNTSTVVSSTRGSQSSDKTGWFIVIVFGCYSVATAVGKTLPIFGILYNKKTILCNCLVQLVTAVPILLIYFEPCAVSGLQADWVAYLTVGLFGFVTGYGICAALMLLAPGQRGKSHEEGLATSIGYMFLQLGRLLGMGVSLFLVDFVFEAIKP
ncbi:uncharacterized protein LOC110054982 [Orbicella faveolata]|uniref:uncharacterized protein LOC110054967 n=1 Tax=Orbicella faveolata TaxID=48498 RepID=UPI0009E53E24|nr:uncharacterized protein LOC110054967 [Orbicella faveolata]XP_020617020.1 uncharacterized protein LOC110054982 [Orbicella faveolata]